MTSTAAIPRSFARRWTRRILWAIALGGVVLAVFVLGFYLEEDWRGARAWAACRQRLEARGEQLDWRAFIPPAIPDASNLAMAPLFVRELAYRVDPKTHVYTFGPPDKRLKDLNGMPYPGGLPSFVRRGGWDLARPNDLAGFARVVAAAPGAPLSAGADALRKLDAYTPVLDELAKAAAERPQTRFPVDYWRPLFESIDLSHLNLEQRFVTTLCLRASARLDTGDSASALADLELSWRLCGGFRETHILINDLLEDACLHATLTPLWEGLAVHRWSGIELARLDQDLKRFDPLADYLSAIRGERAFGLHSIDDYFKRFAELSYASEPDNPFAAMPRGWWDTNKVAIVEYEQRYAIGALDLHRHTILPASWKAFTREIESSRALPTDFYARMAVPVLEGVGRRGAKIQAGFDMAIIACALERHFLDHQSYPAQLGALVPAYLEHVPTDVINGGPLHYQLTPDGRYQLYSLGWNARDDGGHVAWDESGQLDNQHGDWVWQYSPLSPPSRPSQPPH